MTFWGKAKRASSDVGPEEGQAVSSTGAPVSRRRSFLLKLVLLGLATVVLFGFLRNVFAQNSTKKIRVQPSATASKIGTAIQWRTDFTTARRESAASGKPILWYVPRLPDTFMDRKKEVDRYMRAGFWSVPEVYTSANQNYIPLMLIPDRPLAEAYDLQRFKFIEPGFLVLKPDASVSFKIDRITTMSPQWAASLFKQATDVPLSDELIAARAAMAKSDYEAVLQLAGDSVGLELYQAMALFRLNRHADAKQKFTSTAQRYPNHPLGWKAAAESQGIGPFVRGFETVGALPEAALQAGIQSPGSAAPKGCWTEAQLWRRGVEFLLTMQSEDGGFKDSDYDFGGTDSLPNVHLAVTSLCAMALLDARNRDDLADLRPRLDKAIDAAAKYAANNDNLNTRDKDEIFWALLYRLRLFNKLAAIDRDWMKAVTGSLEALEGIQSARNGDWYHEYRNPFVTASALWAIHEAKQLGATADPNRIKSGVAALQRCRYRDGGFTYQSSRQWDKVPTKVADLSAQTESAGRMPLCEGALLVSGASTQKDLIRSIRLAFDRHANMARALKYDNHTSEHNYGGFFFWYCMRSRTEAITKVEDTQLRVEFAQRQRNLVLDLPELDGCFVDSHEIGRTYGTAMALLSLADCETEIETKE